MPSCLRLQRNTANPNYNATGPFSTRENKIALPNFFVGGQFVCWLIALV